MKHRCLIVVVLFFLVAWNASAAPRNADCLKCHGSEASETTQSDKGELTPSNLHKLKDSAHRNMACGDCHRGAVALPHEKQIARVDCGSCHKEEKNLFLKSTHGISLQKGDKDAPSCVFCHGSHGIYPVNSNRSAVSRENIALVCARCHTDMDIEKRHGLPAPEMIKAYDSSVHGRILKNGRFVRAAVCTDCHGSHLVLNPKSKGSRLYKTNIPSVCGKCHVQVYNEYKKSIHARSLEQGKMDSPVCTDCHGEHTLTVVKDPSSRVYARNIPTTCAKCHTDQEIIGKYSLPTDRYSSFIGSFHGVAIKFGDLTAANCTSCHEAHRILPASDPESSINKANLSKTCGKCHPQLQSAILQGRIHVEARKESSPGMYYVRGFYKWFIGILMGFFVVYIILDIYGRIKRRGKNDGSRG
jgi:predicted CXXCH cytochrome family protein